MDEFVIVIKEKVNTQEVLSCVKLSEVRSRLTFRLPDPLFSVLPRL